MDASEVRQQRFLSIPRHEWAGVSGGERAMMIIVAAIGLGGLLILLVWAWFLLLG